MFCQTSLKKYEPLMYPNVEFTRQHVNMSTCQQHQPSRPPQAWLQTAADGPRTGKVPPQVMFVVCSNREYDEIGS